MEKNQLCLDMAGLVGHGTVRACVAGFEDRPFTEEEMHKAEKFLADSMEAGAFGFSSGLIYPPGVYSTREEMVNFARVVKAHDGIYTSHIRSESYGLIDAVTEAIHIAEEIGVSVEISHHKAAGKPNHDKIRTTLQMIADARAKGLNVNCDVYPYDAASTNFNSILPPWALEGGIEKMLERLADPEARTRMIADMKDENPNWESFYQLTGWEGMYITECSVDKYADRTMAEIAHEENADPFEKALDILLESRNNTMMIVFFMDPVDVSRAIANPNSMVCTDGFPSKKKSHPRYYGSCVRVLEKYVKQEHLLSLQQAIYKMSGMPAAKLGLTDRGILAEGKKTDILVIDLEQLHDNATYKEDKAVCDGMGTFQSSRWRPMCRAVVPKCAAMALAVRSLPMPVVSISIPKVWFFMGCAPFAWSLRFPAGLFARPARRDTFITLRRRKSNPTEATRIRAQNSSDLTRAAPGKKRFLIRQNGLFRPPAASIAEVA